MYEDFEEKYFSEGYYIFSHKEKDSLVNLRTDIVSIFSNMAKANGLNSIKSEDDIIRLYKSEDRDLWVKVYDQLGFLPGIMGMSNDPSVLEIVKRCGIRQPVVGYNNAGGRGGLPVLAHMPNDDERLYQAHQDIAYLPYSKNSVTMWIPLQDVSLELGPLEVIPGSHKKFGLIHYSGVDVKQIKLDESFDEDDFIPLPVKAGEAIVFSNFLVHRSGRNRGDKMRLSFQLRFNDLASPEYLKRKFNLDCLSFGSETAYSVDA